MAKSMLFRELLITTNNLLNRTISCTRTCTFQWARGVVAVPLHRPILVPMLKDVRRQPGVRSTCHRSVNSIVCTSQCSIQVRVVGATWYESARLFSRPAYYTKARARIDRDCTIVWVNTPYSWTPHTALGTCAAQPRCRSWEAGKRCTV